MKMKKIIIVLICILSIFQVTGCAKKEAISADNFDKIAEENSLIITDAKDQFPDNPELEDARIASSIAGWQIEFFIFDDEEHAKNVYTKNKNDFDTNKDKDKSAFNETNTSNYSSYTLNSNGNYMHICRINNTVLYLNVPESNKDEVKKIVKELGY